MSVTKFPIIPRINIPRINKTAVKRRVYANDNYANVHSIHEKRTDAQVAELRGSVEAEKHLLPDDEAERRFREVHIQLIGRHRELHTEAHDVDPADASSRLITAMRVYLHGAGPYALAHLLGKSLSETMQDIGGDAA